MVAVIHTSANLRATLTYNEKKVQAEQAVCLMAENYPKAAADLTPQQKLNLLQRQADLNLRTKVNSVHISLNFDPSERLTEDQLASISACYMNKIGFGNQPYLVYEHRDAGHPHIHIVSTNIRPDGSRIPMHNLGRNFSEPARKQIEIDFNLVKAADKKQQMYEIKPVLVKANYGRTETKRAIANVLAGVIDQYKFTSIPELNAVLNRYNVAADRGGEDSRTYKKGGLHYRLLNEKAERIGVPIKASTFAKKPTLAYLQTRFEINENRRQEDKLRIKNAIDFALFRRTNVTLDGLKSVLKKDGIDTVIRSNDSGVIYGITYIDHQTKAVFNGSALGKNYSAKAIQERCAPVPSVEQNNELNSQQVIQNTAPKKIFMQKGQSKLSFQQTGAADEGPRDISDKDTLFDPVKQNTYMPGQLRSSRKKRKKKILSQQL